MSNRSDHLAAVRVAVSYLMDQFSREVEGDQPTIVGHRETVSAYHLDETIKSEWLESSLKEFGEVLLPAGFECRLHVLVSRLGVWFRVLWADGSTHLSIERVEDIDVEEADTVPPAAVNAYLEVQERWKPQAPTLSTVELSAQLNKLESNGMDPQFRIQCDLNKENVNRTIESSEFLRANVKIVTYLFADNLVSALSRSSLVDIETAYFESRKRTLILVIGLEGILSSHGLTIMGESHFDQFPAHVDMIELDSFAQRSKKVHDFFHSQNSWLRPVTWLIPEVFQWSERHNSNNWDATAKSLYFQLSACQVLLCMAFLADKVNETTVEYAGLGKIPLTMDTLTLSNHIANVSDLYNLYTYAYDTYSPTNLELVQQFIAVIVRSPEDLLTRALQVKSAAKRAYANVLKNNVRDYFDARDKIQSRLKTAVEEVTSSVLALTKGMAEDVYKSLGVVVLAFVTAFLSPDSTAVALFLGFVAIAAYLVILVKQYVPTLEKNSELRLEQHNQYMLSYRDVLEETEINELISKSPLERSKTEFAQKLKLAKQLYTTAFFIVVVLAVISPLLFASLSIRTTGSNAPVQMIMLTPTAIPTNVPTSTATSTSTTSPTVIPTSIPTHSATATASP